MSDRKAQARAAELRYSPKKKQPLNHLEESQRLEVVITLPNQQSYQPSASKETLLRTVPITEINTQLAHRFTTVLAAATTLTATEQSPQTNNPTSGIDIDLR